MLCWISEITSWQCIRSQFATFFRKIESTKAQRVPHPYYHPDRAPSDFFLFGYMKEKLRGTLFTARDDLIFARQHIFSEIPEMILKNVFTNWITRLSWVMMKSGKYYTKSSKKNRIIFLEQKFWLCRQLSNRPTNCLTGSSWCGRWTSNLNKQKAKKER
jgi:transposase